MRVTFVSPNRETLPDPVEPLGLLAVLAASEAAGHDCELVDLCFEAEPLATLRARLDATCPDVVAVGLRNLMGGDYRGSTELVSWYEAVLTTIRAATDAPVVLGGGAFSVLPERLMRRLRPDYGLAGEGERSLSALLAALGRQAPELANIGGLYRWDADGALRSTPLGELVEAGALPTVDRGRVDPRYHARHGIAGIQTKRGCPLRCDYCTYPRIEGRASRRRDPDAVAREMLAVRAACPDVGHFFVVDAVFNLPATHAKAVCRAMIGHRIDTPWTCYANPIGLDAELAELMAAAGCAGAEMGVDSGSDRVLGALRKGFTTADVVRAHTALTAAGVPTCATFLIGAPGETLVEARETLAFCAELDPAAAILVTWTDEREAFGETARRVDATDRETLLGLLASAAARQPSWIVPNLGLHYDPATIDRVRRAGVRGPLWQALAGGGRRRRRREAMTT